MAYKRSPAVRTDPRLAAPDVTTHKYRSHGCDPMDGAHPRRPANRRVVLPEAFLAADELLETLMNVCDGLVIYPEVIARRVMEELPFMATENILMAMVVKATTTNVARSDSFCTKPLPKSNSTDAPTISERIRADEAFAPIRGRLDSIIDPNQFIGRAPLSFTPSWQWGQPGSPRGAGEWQQQERCAWSSRWTDTLPPGPAP